MRRFLGNCEVFLEKYSVDGGLEKRAENGQG